MREAIVRMAIEEGFRYGKEAEADEQAVEPPSV